MIDKECYDQVWKEARLPTFGSCVYRNGRNSLTAIHLAMPPDQDLWLRYVAKVRILNNRRIENGNGLESCIRPVGMT